ncbi:hypothetical protein F2P81_006094 [Scophthalmus maximus]|uniref:Uncharacterized protein n=1 Tax=Scophthalmus maximus TaxID=52904 RepID=A0A6A4TKK6_SCOMX|nr:hypothetical protein F2P81_006094 [Scophthalmus maximus]
MVVKVDGSTAECGLNRLHQKRSCCKCRSLYRAKKRMKKSCLRFTGSSGFYMTKQLYYETPPASLGRHQMRKDDLFFLDFNCLIIPASSEEIMLHQADFPFGKAIASPPWFEPQSLDMLIKSLTR